MKNLKFSALAQNALNERKMNSLTGGSACGCACRSNSSIDNGTANRDSGKHSEDMDGGSIFLPEVIVER